MALEVGTNSYVSVENADAYFADRLGSDAWAGDDREKALIAATRAVERLAFVGRRKEALQPLQFPRCYAEPRRHSVPGNNDGLAAIFRGEPPVWLCEAEVPKAVKDAVCEEALAILKDKDDAQADLRGKLQRQGVTSIKMGSTTETYSGAGASASLRSEEAESLLSPYVASVAAFG